MTQTPRSRILGQIREPDLLIEVDALVFLEDLTGDAVVNDTNVIYEGIRQHMGFTDYEIVRLAWNTCAIPRNEWSAGSPREGIK